MLSLSWVSMVSIKNAFPFHEHWYHQVPKSRIVHIERHKKTVISQAEINSPVNIYSNTIPHWGIWYKFYFEISITDLYESVIEYFHKI